MKAKTVFAAMLLLGVVAIAGAGSGPAQYASRAHEPADRQG
jgi:hypothetical protein